MGRGETMKTAGNGPRIFLALVIVGLTGTATGIQNDRTFSRRSRHDDIVLSASVYTGPEKTSSQFDRDASLTFEKTHPAYHHLESSRTVQNTNHDRPGRSYGAVEHQESMDGLSSSKQAILDQIDGNNIEVKTGEYGGRRLTVTNSETTQPGEEEGAPQGRNLLSEPQPPPRNGISSQQPTAITEQEQRQQQQRQARQESQRIYSEHAPAPVLQTASLGQRQANPDIQDIITGIVKLLNGNVNVAANTVRPLRPIQATRINNRGPPRISDVPPLPPDFDTPGMNPPPPPAPHRPGPGGSSTPDRPYPFEKPPAPERPLINQLPPERPVRPFLNGVPLPEQIVPQTQENRPWPWTGRPSAGNRRPIPAYKPFPQSNLDSGVHREKDQHLSEKPQFDVKRKPEPQTSEPSKKVEMAESENISSNSSENGSNSATTTSIGAASTSMTTIDDNSASDDNGHNLSKATEGPNTETGTKKSELEDPGKKGPQKQPTTKDKTGAAETLILGVPSTNGVRQNNTIFSKKTRPDESKATSTITGAQKSGEKGVKPAVSRTGQIKTFSTSTLSIETSSSVQLIEPTSTKVTGQTSSTRAPIPDPVTDQSTPVFLNTGFVLEPSRATYEDLETTERSDSPTDTLPQTVTSRRTTEQPGTIRPTSSNSHSKNTGPAATDRYAYRPRPGIVLDDTLDYPGAQGLATQWPYIPTRHPSIGDIFDVTVSAVQGPGGSTGEGVRVPVNVGGAGSDVILTSAVEGQGFVSIDGKRTYLNLFDNTERTSTSSTVQPHPTRTAQTPAIVGTGFAVPQPDQLGPSPSPGRPSVGAGVPGAGTPGRRPIFSRRPTQPPVRIDTCIVGDTSTCDASQHEACATVQGVSACHCKPGYARLQHSLPCKKIVSIVVSMRVDRIYDRRIVWDRGLEEKDSESYQTLAYEANRAIESAMSMTPFSDEYMGSSVNGVYQGDISQGQGGVFVNATLKLTYEPRTVRPSLAGELQRHLLGVIHRRNNNIGNSALYVDSPPGSISNLQDLDECASTELNDCHSSATCANTWGGFLCTCNQGLKDPHKDDPNESGRSCVSCPSTYCNNRGTCSYQADQMQCTCTGNYYGAQCEVDGEVLGVAIGASVAALIIIVLTLVCLVMWSRRWSREQKSVGSPVYGYIQGGVPGTLPGTLARVGSVGTLASVKQGPPPTNIPPYLWPHFTDHLATANVYATEPMGPTRPSSAMFGYPPLNVHGTLPPVPLPRLQAPPRPRQRHQPDPDSSDSEMQDKDRADLIPQHTGFHVPRPKSRSSLANQSGIYNDVEYDQGDVHHLSKNNIPMSTYRPYYRT